MENRPESRPSPEVPNEALKQISSFFGLGEVVLKEKIQEGKLNDNYRMIELETGTSYFLRGHRHKDKGMVEKFHAAERFFAAHNIPVLVALSRGNESVVEAVSKLYSVYPWIEGVRADAINDEMKALRSVASVQADIHLLSKDGAPEGLSDRRGSGWDKKNSLEEFSRIEQQVQAKSEKDEIDAITLEKIALQRALVEANDRTLEDFRLDADHLIHGDMNSSNIFFDENDEVKYLFDSEHVQYSARVLEVVKSLDLLCLPGKYDDENFEKARIFLQEYQSRYPLTKEELKNGLRAYVQRKAHDVWLLKEHYDKNNHRVDRIFKNNLNRLRYFSKNLDVFVERILSFLPDES